MSTANNKNGGKATRTTSRQAAVAKANKASTAETRSNLPAAIENSIPLPLVNINESGIIEAVSEKAAAILATPPRESSDLVGMRWDEVWVAAGGAGETADIKSLSAVQATQLDNQPVCLICEVDSKSKQRTVTWHPLPTQPESAEADMFRSMMSSIPINVIMADRNHTITYMNPASVETLRTIEHLLPVGVNDIVGQKIDIFHKNVQRPRSIASNPQKMPHAAVIQLGDEYMELLVSCIRDSHGEMIGAMATWALVTARLRLADEFEANIKTVAETVAEAAGQLQANSMQMAESSQRTTAQSDEANAAAQLAAQNVESVAASTSQLTGAISEISARVHEASSMTSQAVEQAESTDQTIRALGESSQQIGEVIKVITSIAQQTNLLALNATIEAARAGEAGKGFAVVANEVKELARQTARATEEISVKIASIQAATEGSAKAIASIASSIHKIDDIATTIAGAVEEQSVATSDISRSIADAAESTRAVTKAITTITEAARQNQSIAQEILQFGEELSRESNHLNTVSAEFVTRIRSHK